MDVVRARVWKAQQDVDSRLAEMGLTRDGLLKVRTIAMGAGADATPNHPANAAGMLAYLHGVAALRFTFLGEDWVLERLNNMEFIRNDRLKIRVGFSNIKLSGDDAIEPKARSLKGAGAEMACQGNLFTDSNDALPMPNDEWATYFLMVDIQGAAELSRPVINSSNFGPCIERIYLSDGTDFDGKRLPLDDGDIAGEFDPLVARR